MHMHIASFTLQSVELSWLSDALFLLMTVDRSKIVRVGYCESCGEFHFGVKWVDILF